VGLSQSIPNPVMVGLLALRQIFWQLEYIVICVEYQNVVNTVDHIRKLFSSFPPWGIAP
jgi:cobalamin biosynthesis Co2+ chelatase CbiK